MSEIVELEPCFDCGEFNISRRLYKNDEHQSIYECNCRDCDASWLEEVDDSI